MSGYSCIDVIFLVLFTTLGRKPFGAVSEEVLTVDDLVIDTFARKCNVGRVRIHLAVLKQRSLDVSVVEIIVELQHAEFRILIDEEAN